MLEYIIRRLGLGLLVIVASSVILFTIMQLLPGGDPISLITDPKIPIEKKQELRHRWGLDKPAPVRFVLWATNVVKGDMGVSISRMVPVSDLLKQKMPYTLIVVIPSIILSYLIAVPLGLITAYKMNTFIDKGTVVSALILYSIPGFIFGIFLIKVFGVDLKLFPISGFNGVKSLVLPIATLTVASVASIIRMVRSEVIGVIQSKFVETAYAKGLSTRKVLVRHVLQNSLISTTISLFLGIPAIISGAIIIENLFAIPGMGTLVMSSVMGHDYPVVQGIFLIISILTVVSNLTGDIISAILDPRIKLAMKGGQA